MPPTPIHLPRSAGSTLLLTLALALPLLGLTLPPHNTSRAATLHVWLDSPNPTPPFASWETAARSLQDAADAATAGDTVLVTNGVYATGGRPVRGNLTNRVVVPAGVILQSVAGPEVTIIEGAPRSPIPGQNPTPPPGSKPDPGNGDGAVRCAFLGHQAVLAGFTLRNGHTLTNGTYDWDMSGGGAWSDTQARLVKCILTNNAAHHMGGASFRVDVDQSRVVNNRARYGGGVALAAVTDSDVSRNTAENGGGAYLARLLRCTVTDNNANIGGGSMGGSMRDSLIRGNTAGQWGGGVSQTSLQHCRVERNKAERGGGTFGANVFGSIITANSADLGGGAAGGTLRHCTVTGNTAGSGGGTYLVSVHHGIVRFNDAIFGPNHEGSTFIQSFTSPLPTTGSGNRDDDPLLASVSHLSADSPCQAIDITTPELPTDIDGEPWLSPSSIGADQFTPGQATGPLEVRIQTPAPTLTVAAGFSALWTTDITGRTTASEWNFGDGRIVRNQPFVRHAWDQPGSYLVTLTAFNDSFPEGITASLEITVVPPPVLHVAPTSANPLPPFASWNSAATTIQSAIDAASVPGSVILVTNGTYNRGGAYLPGDAILNRVALSKPVVVQSVNGPEVTHIVGAGPFGDSAIRCAFVGRDAILNGFILTNGYTRTLGAPPREQRGGGVAGEALGTVTNCSITGNFARQFGAGAYRANLLNCSIRNNQSLDGGGGAYECVVTGGIIESNTASNSGGGASRSSITNTLIARNTAPLGSGAYFGTLQSCRLEANASPSNGYGGGANASTLRDCTLVANLAYSGGGAYAATLERCTLLLNEARRDGGGATASTLSDCTIATNSATHGGGAALSSLSRCTLSGNQAAVAGGGVDGGDLDLCTLSGNSAFYGGASENASIQRSILRDNSAVFGGAAYQDLLLNCILIGNTASNQGGAAFNSQLIHCTVSANHALEGGGTFSGTNRNSILYFNTALAGPESLQSLLISSCTPPTPGLPDNTITQPPSFRDPVAGDFRLRGDSPCIDAGTNALQWVSDDFLGSPRPIDGNLDGHPASDIGAFEYNPETTDSNGDGIPDAWYLRHGLNPADPDLANSDPDQDGLGTYEEWIADTHPTDPGSTLTLSISNHPPLSLHIQANPGRLYTLLTRDAFNDPSDPSATWQPVPGQIDLPGTGGSLLLQDTNGASTRYYRVLVRWPEENRPVLASLTARPRTASLSHPTHSPSPAPNAPSRPPTDTTSASPTLAAHSPILDAADSATLMAPEPAVSETFLPRPRRALLTPPKPILPHRFRIPTHSDIPISPMLRGQEPFMLYARSARFPTLEWGRGATYRGVAGGTDAETYDWKRLTSSTRPHYWSHFVSDPPVVTTLEWLEEARDYNAELVLTINTRGSGRTIPDALGLLRWTVDPASNQADALARLAADWVRYVNLIAPRYRLTPDGNLPAQLETTDPEAHRVLKELASFGNGSNAWAYRLATVDNPDLEVDPWIERPLLLPHDATTNTRPVTYWEIGNEVETPMNASDPRGARPMDPTINLNPAQYVERYLRITDAMRQVDPSIRVGPCPNNPWGPRPGIENEHLIRLLARPDATVDVLYYHYYPVWAGDYFRPSDVNRNLRGLKNYAHLLHSQYAAHFARASRARVPVIISEWNPDWLIHPPIERNLVSALATADVILTFAELQVLGAHYWENPASRASAFVFSKLQTHLGDRFLGSSYGEPADDGSYASFGSHPSSATDVRIYASQRSSDNRVFLWMINLSDTTAHTILWDHPLPIRNATLHTLKYRAGPNAYYAPVSQVDWISETAPANLASSPLPPSTLAILEIEYAPTTPPSPPVIHSLSHSSSPAGAEILIAGDGFSPEPSNNVVHFGTAHAPVLEASPSLIRTLVPGSATYGPASVTVHGRTAYSPGFFSLAPNPDLNNPIPPDALQAVPLRIYPPEGAPMVTALVDVLLADWDASGRLNLAGLTTRSGSVLPHTIDLYPNTSLPGQPAFSTPICSPQMPGCSLPLNSSPARIATADLDGDGFLDLACVDRHAWHVATWRNARPASDRTFDMVASFPTARVPSHLAIHDIDQDGRPDIVVTQSGDNSIGVLRNISPGPGFILFATNRIFRAADPSEMIGPHAIVAADLAGDPRPDIAVASRGSLGLTVFRNESTPGNIILLPQPEITGARIESLAAGDIDGDGLADLVASGQWPDGGVRVWRRTQQDTFERSDFPAPRDPRQVRVTDVNGDGLPDVLTVNNDTSTVSVLRNRSKPGTVALDTRRDFPIPGLLPNDPICLAVGDIDGDSHPDVVVGHYYSGFLTLLRNQPQAPEPPTPTPDP
jgi:hypothetical protein